MKGISISLETLSDKTLRATGRHDGRTVESFEGKDGRLLVIRAMKSAAAAHELPNGGFDMTHIQLNEAARVALYPRTEQTMNTETDTINPRNYSLCEAAPDLLAALEQIVTAADGQLDSPVYFEIHRVLINNARAAIAKAKGDK